MRCVGGECIEEEAGGVGGDKRWQNGTCCPNVASVHLFNAWTEDGKEMTKAFLLLSSSLLLMLFFFFLPYCIF